MSPDGPEVPGEAPEGSLLEQPVPPDDVRPTGPAWSAAFSAPVTRRGAVLLVLVLLATGATYFARLGTPGEEIPLDEKHYVPDARDVLSFGTESDTRVSEESGAFVVHPPVGKWFIAAGIRLFGDDGLGWRFFGAVVGTLSVAIVYLLARRLWASAWFAAAAAVLLAADGLWFVQSRVAMLDIYGAFFVLAGVWLVFEDRDRAAGTRRRPRWWRLAAGASLGFALATKWSTIPFVGAVILLAVVWESLRLRALHRVEPVGLWRTLGRILWSMTALAGTFLLLPAALYVATYAPWFLDEHRYDPPACVSTEEDPRRLPSRWLCYQGEMLQFHSNLAKYETVEETRTPTPAGDEETRTPTPAGDKETVTVTKPGHPYFSQGWSWPWIGRPVAHFYEVTGEGDRARRSEILGIPNPLVWMPGFFVGVPLLLWWSFGESVRGARRRRRARRRDPPRPDAVSGAVQGTVPDEPWPPEPPPAEPRSWLDPVAPVLLLLFTAGYGPILIADLVDRPVFLFYATPMVPFVVLALVHVLVRMTRGGERVAWIAAGYVGAAVILFAYFYPVLAAWPLGTDGFFGWGARIWYSTQPLVQIGGFRFPPLDCGVANAIKTFCWI